MYREFYAISKTQMGNASYNKWDDYELIVDRNIYNKVQQYIPIYNYGGTKNNKGFRITKNGQNTGIFTKKDAQDIRNGDDDIMNNINNQNDININTINTNVANNLQMPQNIPVNRINIVPIKKIDIDKNDD